MTYSYTDHSGISLKISTNKLVPIFCSGIMPMNNEGVNIDYSGTTINSSNFTYNNCAHSWSSVSPQLYSYPTGLCTSDETSQCGPAFWGHAYPGSQQNADNESWRSSRIGISTRIPVGDSGVSRTTDVSISKIEWTSDPANTGLTAWEKNTFLTDQTDSKSIFAIQWNSVAGPLNDVNSGLSLVWNSVFPTGFQKTSTPDHTEIVGTKYPQYPDLSKVVVTINHSNHEYSVKGLLGGGINDQDDDAGLYSVQIISHIEFDPEASGVPWTTGLWEQTYSKKYLPYSFEQPLSGEDSRLYQVPKTVWATAPTFFAIIEPAPTKIDTINHDGVAPYNEETRSYVGNITVKLATNSSFSPDVGDFNTIPSFGPITVGLFSIIQDSDGVQTPGQNMFLSTTQSTNNDMINYIIENVQPGKYFIGAKDTNAVTTYFSTPIDMKDGKIFFQMQDIFAPRNYDPNSRSIPLGLNALNPNFYGTCFCWVEAIVPPELVFTPVLDITTKQRDYTRPERASSSEFFSLYKSIQSISDPDKLEYYYKVSGLSPGAYVIAISANFGSQALQTTIYRTMTMSSVSTVIKANITTKEDTTSSTNIATKSSHSPDFLILPSVPNGSFDLSIDGPKSYKIFEEFIPSAVDQDLGNYSFLKTGIEYYYYKPLTIENKYKIDYRLGSKPNTLRADAEASLSPIYIDGTRIENTNRISNLPSCYLEVIIRDILDNSPTLVSAKFKNIISNNVTLEEYGRKMLLFPEISTYQILRDIINSNAILVDIPEKMFTMFEPVYTLGCSTTKGSTTVLHNMTSDQRTKVKALMIVLGDCIDPDNTTIINIDDTSLTLSKPANDTCENTTLTIITIDRISKDKGLLANITNTTNNIKVVNGNINLLKKGDILIAKGLATDTRVVSIDKLNKTIDISKETVETILNNNIVVIEAVPGTNCPRIQTSHGFQGWPSDTDACYPNLSTLTADKKTGTLNINVVPGKSEYTVTEKTEGGKTYYNSQSLELSPGVYTIRGDENYLTLNKLLDDIHTVVVTINSTQYINLVFNKSPTADVPYTLIP